MPLGDRVIAPQRGAARDGSAGRGRGNGRGASSQQQRRGQRNGSAG